jgi:hypothetical protein
MRAKGELRQRLIITATALLFLSCLSVASGEFIETIKDTYMLGELVRIHLDYDNPNATVLIKTDTATYEFLGDPSDSFVYMPRIAGIHTIVIVLDGTTIAEKNITIEQPRRQVGSASLDNTDRNYNITPKLAVDKTVYYLGEHVTISIDGSLESLELVHREKSFEFFGQQDKIIFAPPMAGPYEVIATIDGTQLREDFIVNIRSADKPVGTVEVLDRKNRVIRSTVIDSGLDYIELLFPDSPIESILFEDIDLSNGISLGLDQIYSLIPIDLARTTSKTYAIDPTALDFTTARVTAIATASELFKCADWDFENAICRGSWQFLMNLTPGEPYSFTLTPYDPAFGETDTTVDFDRRLDCDQCGQHKTRPFSYVNMTITVETTDPIQNAYVTDYFHNSWQVTVANGGTVSTHNSTYDKITWYVGSVNDTISIDYEILAPGVGIPPVDYYFTTEIHNGSSAKSDPWRVKVADAGSLVDEINAPCDTGSSDYCTPSPIEAGTEVAVNVRITLTSQNDNIDADFWLEYGAGGGSGSKAATTTYLLGDVSLCTGEEWALNDSHDPDISFTGGGSCTWDDIADEVNWVDNAGSQGEYCDITYYIIPCSNTYNATDNPFDIITAGRRTGGSANLNLNEYLDEYNVTAPVTNYAPTWSNPQSYPDTIYQYMMATCNVSWSDDHGLSGYIFSINQTGNWVNTSWIAFTSNNVSTNITNITASTNTVVEWRFYANDSDDVWNMTDIQTFSVADAADDTAPSITNPAVSPGTAVTRSLFNISATITDGSNVAAAYAEITPPNGSAVNYSMTGQSGGGTWYRDYKAYQGGNYSAIIFARDPNSNWNHTRDEPVRFNVTSTMAVGRYFYGRGETVSINGTGFSAGRNITVYIYDGSTVSGYPKNVTSDAQGNVYESWTVPASSAFKPGNYTITLNDTVHGWLRNGSVVRVIIKPDSAMQWDDSVSALDVHPEINRTDDSTTTIDCKNAEDYIQMNFTDVIPSGYVVSNVTIYVEHSEAIAGYTYYLTWWNGTTWELICTVPNRATETLDYCNATQIDTIDEINDLSIRFTDNNANGNNEDADVDFAFIDLQYSPSTEMSVTITDPSPLTYIYDYTDSTNNKAYKGINQSLTITSIQSSTPATAEEYTNLTDSDNLRFHMISSTSGYHVYESFRFKITQSVPDISTLDILHEGYATEQVSPVEDTFHLYLWNYTSGQYALFRTAPATLSDQENTVSLDSSTINLNDHIDGDGNLWFLVVGDLTIGTGGDARADIYTDYVEVSVSTIPLVQGFQNVNATAVDADTVANCWYHYRNTTLNTSWVGMENTAGYDWNNLSDSNVVADGYYYIDVNCTDVPGASNEIDSLYVRIDNGGPGIILEYPLVGQNFSIANVTFGWNATDTAGGLLSCNLSIDGVVNNTSPYIVTSGTDFNVTLNNTPDGFLSWYVSCWDSLGNKEVSQAWNYTVDTHPPTIALSFPPSEYWNSTGDIIFYYTPEDSIYLRNCSLIINGRMNQTNATVVNGTMNNFTLTGLAEGSYEWSINCTDFVGNINSSDTRFLYIDYYAPKVVRYTPQNESAVGPGTIYFNFSVEDSVDWNMTCNLTVDNVVEYESFNVENGTNASRGVSIADQGWHNWTVDCWDNASNVNRSDTWWLLVDGPPVVELSSPADGTWNSSENVTLWYKVTDRVGNILNCSLILDGVFNQVNQTAVVSGELSYFNATQLAQGLHNWSVNCTDASGFTGNSEIWGFWVDYERPKVIRYWPLNLSSVNIGTVYFNFSVEDSVDWNMTCNLTVDNVVEYENANAMNGTNTSLPVVIWSEGWHNWTVDCWDNASNINLSDVWYFQAGGAPRIVLSSPADSTWNRSENVTLWYNATEGGSILNCSLILDGVFDQVNQTAVSNGEFNFFNVSQLPQGMHNWSVNCTDNSGETGNSSVWKFWVDYEAPNLVLVYPGNSSFVDVGAIYFNFSVYDYVDWNLTCNLTVDNVVEHENANAENGTNTSLPVTISTRGWHNWSVDCWDNASNINRSAVYVFYAGQPPHVELYKPPDGHWNQSENLTLWYNATDNVGILNCSLFIDGKYNQTNQTAVLEGEFNYFNITQLSEGQHNWSVNCTDPSGMEGNSSTWRFTIDHTPPRINLSFPNDVTFTTQTVHFNFTATDSHDWNITCNLTVDGIVEDEAFNVSNGTMTNRTVTGLSADIHYWNVTCWDRLGNRNTSMTWNFTVSLAPDVFLNDPLDETGDPDGNITFIYVVDDPVGVYNCTLIINDKINQTNQTYLKLGDLNNFTLTELTEGEYNWTVNCTDITGLIGTEYPPWTVYVDYHNPNITIHAPPDMADIHVENVTINFTAYDNLDPELTCNLTLNGTVNQSGFAAINGQPTVTNFTELSEGWWYWNLTCWDHAGRQNETGTRWFYMNFSMSLELLQPADGDGDGDGDLTFTYLPVDNSGIAWCVFIVNNHDNQTNITIKNSEVNPFELSNLAQGDYNWSINCSAWDGEYRETETRDFYVDLFAPQVVLNAPAPNQTLNWSTVLFNFTSIDSYANETYCNVTVDDIIQNSNPLVAKNGTPYDTSYGNFTDGIHFWNVTCWDAVDHLNNSETRNFTIQELPTIYLDSPANNSWTNSQSVIFYFNVSDNTGIANCTLIWDNKANVTNQSIANRATNNISLSGISNGLHNWSINCTDNSSLSLVGSSETWLINVDWIDPRPLLLEPPNGTWQNESEVTFGYDVDEQNIDICELWGNFTGAWAYNQTDPSPREGESNYFDAINFSDGSYIWNVRCNDSAGNWGWNNTNWTLYIDTVDPDILLQRPPNATWDNGGEIIFNFSLSEPHPDHCELWGNFTGAWKRNETLASPQYGANNEFDAINMSDGFYIWNVWCNDSAGNYAWNNTNWTVWVDTHAPTIDLIAPKNNTNLTTRDVNFNFTTSDNIDLNMTCNLTIDNQVNVSGINATSGSYTIVLVEGLSLGMHNWSVLCWDDALNYNQSPTWWFNITPPDLAISADLINFSTATLEENVNITINATVLNIGSLDLTNVVVRFYERKLNDVVSGYTQLNGDKTIDISANTNGTVGINWTPKIGDYEILVAVDPDNAISESDELNNNASKNITVSLYHTLYGNTTGRLSIADAEALSIYAWTVTNSTASNLFVADSDSSISWTALYPLSRNTTHDFQYEDFDELDITMGSENLTDSINTTYFYGGSLAGTENYTVFKRVLNDTPVVNSTNTSSYTTGILWDSSDLSILEYNGTQDVIFITKVMETSQGAFADVEYEMKIPAYLRRYLTATTDSVTFYAELK